jgi:hypothetical protein
LPNSRWTPIACGRSALSRCRGEDIEQLGPTRRWTSTHEGRRPRLLLGFRPCGLRSAGVRLMRRRRGAKPVTWAQQIFQGSAMASRGGPVRRHFASIVKHSSPRIVVGEAKLHGWHIVAIGDHWLFYSNTLRQRQVLGRSTAPGPRKPRRKPTKHRSRAFPTSYPICRKRPCYAP